MKKQGRIIKVLLMVLIVTGTLFSPVKRKVAAEGMTKDIAVGTVYDIGDVIKFGGAVANVDNGIEVVKMLDTYTVNEPNWEQDDNEK